MVFQNIHFFFWGGDNKNSVSQHLGIKYNLIKYSVKIEL